MVEIDFRESIFDAAQPLLLFAEEVERLNYGGVWYSHSVGRDFRRLDTLIFLSGVAARTRRIKLGTAVFQVPLYAPVALARMLMALDHLSDGRLIWGVGTGWVRKEFENLGVPFSERAGRTDEALDIVKRLWTEEEVTYEGKYFRIFEARIEPKPIQKPHPKILIGGVWGGAQRGDPGVRPHLEWSERAIHRIVKFGDGWITPSSIRPERAAEIMGEGMDRIKTIGAKLGRTIKDEEFELVAEAGSFNINESRERAVEEARQRYASRVARGFFQVMGNPAFEETLACGAYGPPEEVAVFVKRWLEVNNSVPALKRVQFNLASLDPVEQLRRFHDQVQPLLGR